MTAAEITSRNVKRLGDGTDTYRIGNVVEQAGGRPVCAFPGKAAVERFGVEQYEGNARLIAAAPFAPHECTRVECPGSVVWHILRRLAGGYATAADAGAARALLANITEAAR